MIVIVPVAGLVVAVSPEGRAPVNEMVAVGKPEATMVMVWARLGWNTGPVTTGAVLGTVPVVDRR